MTNNYKIAIVGSPDTINGFKLLGIETMGVKDQNEALQALNDLKEKKLTTNKDQKEEQSLYAIIFITEDLAEKIPGSEMKKLTSDVLPAIIPLPSHLGSTGFGNKRLSKIVEQAVGSDILGDK